MNHHQRAKADVYDLADFIDASGVKLFPDGGIDFTACDVAPSGVLADTLGEWWRTNYRLEMSRRRPDLPDVAAAEVEEAIRDEALSKPDPYDPE